MASQGWLTRERILVFLLLTVPRCTCNGCGPSNESCGPDFSGGGDCESANTCPSPVPGTHTISNTASGFWGGGACTLTCEQGWSDCDGLSSNGCETAGSCPAYHIDASPVPSPTLVATLTGAPRGLAVCGADVYYFDDDRLERAHDASVLVVLTSDGVPAGGIACDASNVYWSTLSAMDGGSPTGSVWALTLGETVQALATGVDPGRGIDVQGGRVYWLARSGFGDHGPMLAYSTLDGGSLPLMPGMESAAYKAFALSYDGQYSVAGGAVWFAGLDAGPVALDVDASSVSALLAGAGGVFAVSHGPPPVDAGDDASTDASDASDAGDTSDPDDAGDAADAGDASDATDAAPPLPPDFIWALRGASPTAGPFGRIVATTASVSAIVATDDTIYVVDLPTGTMQTVWSSALHVVDVATDGTFAYWTTLGEGTVAGGVWKMALP